MSESAAEALFVTALHHHRQDRLREALGFYQAALAAKPDHCGALFNLAHLVARAGENAQAAALYREVLRLKPEDPDTLCNLGNLEAATDPAGAESFYRRALQIRPDLLAARINLATLCLRAHRAAEAESEFAAVLALDPARIEARAGHAVALMDLGQFDAARAGFEALLRDLPDHADANANLATLLNQAGERGAAIEHYRRALAAEPGRVLCHYNLGVLLQEGEKKAEAMRHLRRAIALDPAQIEARQALSQILHGRGRNRLALQLLEEAAALQPENVQVLFDFGNLWHSTQDYERAEQCFRRALAIEPALPEVLSNLGSTLLARGDRPGAIAMQESAIALDPKLAIAYNNLGNALGEFERLEEARAAYQKGVEIDPELVPCQINLGNTLRLQGRYEEAEQVLRRAIDLQPGDANAYNNYGLVLHAQHRHEEAIAAFREAQTNSPGHPESLNNIAISYQALGQFGNAIRAYRDLIALHPERTPAYFNLGGALQLIGRYDESVTVYQKALDIDPGYNAVYPYLAHGLMQQCSWSNLDLTVARMLANAEAELDAGQSPSVACFGLMTTPASMALRHRVACHLAGQAAAQVAEIKRELNFTHARAAHGRIRVGYVSPDFRVHSVAIAFRGLLEAHDREHFEFCGYSLAPLIQDDFTEFFRRTFDRFRDLSTLSFRDAARQIHDDRIDILIDLAGHTRFSRPGIFALHPAPIQAHYLGYSSTIGGDLLDYLITDRRQVAPGAERHFSEKLVFLPDTFMATTRAEIDPEPVLRAHHGLPEEGFVFCNFNAHYKFEPRLFDIWMRLLKRLPGSVLWLLHGTPTSDRNLGAEAARRGIDPARLVFSRKVSHPRHLARHRLADLALDTLHHGGGVTSVDALWVGVPLVTVAGDSPPARNGASLLHAIGLDDLIAADIAGYEAIAYRLATEPARLDEVRGRLAVNRDTEPLFDPARLTRHLEIAYRTMWERHRAGQAPESFDVPPLPRQEDEPRS